MTSIYSPNRTCDTVSGAMSSMSAFLGDAGGIHGDDCLLTASSDLNFHGGWLFDASSPPMSRAGSPVGEGFTGGDVHEAGMSATDPVASVTNAFDNAALTEVDRQIVADEKTSPNPAGKGRKMGVNLTAMKTAMKTKSKTKSKTLGVAKIPATKTPATKKPKTVPADVPELTADEKSAKVEKIRVRNMRNAKKSRDKKDNTIIELTTAYDEVVIAYDEVLDENSLLRQENLEMREMLASLRL
jgi:hypothetical protein